jgi:hypothetical protein
MRASDSPRDGDVRPFEGRHLSEDEINRFLDDDLAAGEHRQAADHLAHCDHCQQLLTELQFLAGLLRELPEADVPRSFQLDRKYAMAREPVWRRWGGMLLPLLPAMRAGTLALALALGGVTAYRIVDDQPVSRQAQEQVRDRPAQSSSTIAAVAQATSASIPTSTRPAEADTSLKTTADQAADSAEPVSESGAANQADAGAAAPEDIDPDRALPEEVTSSDDQADESAQMQPATSEEATASGGESDRAAGEEENSAMVAMEVGSPAASPSATPMPTNTPTATVIPSETPEPTPTRTPVSAPTVSSESDDRPWLGWAQLSLGALLLALGALVVGLTRLRRGMG